MMQQARHSLAAHRHLQFAVRVNNKSLLGLAHRSASSKSITRDGNHLSKEYQYLPGGPLPSYYFQKSLPLLPVPKLELTCQRYLEALKPLLTPEQHSRTTKIVENFQKGVGTSKLEHMFLITT